MFEHNVCVGAESVFLLFLTCNMQVNKKLAGGSPNHRNGIELVFLSGSSQPRHISCEPGCLQTKFCHDGFFDLLSALQILLVDVQHKMVPKSKKHSSERILTKEKSAPVQLLPVHATPVERTTPEMVTRPVISRGYQGNFFVSRSSKQP